MSTNTVIGRNILSNWCGFIFQILIAFVLTPYIVASLGNTYYGIWALVISLTGYYGLLDLGVSGALTQYISRYYANRDFDRINETVSTGFTVLAACAAVLLLVSLGLAMLADRIFEIPGEAISDVRLAILIVGGGASVQFLFFPYSAIFPATQRFDISNVIGIGTRLLFAASVYVALSRGYGLVGVSVATTATNVLDYSLRLVIAYRLVPSLKISPSLANMARGWELARFGFWNIVIAGSVRLISYSSAIVIALFFPAAAITPFALASNLNEYFMRMFIPIGQVFFPVFTEHDARSDATAIRALFMNGTRLLAVLALPAGLLAYWFSDAFFALWIGKAATKGDYPSAAGLFNVLIIASVVSAVQRVAYQVLLGTRRMRTLSICFLIEGGANLLLSVLLARTFGLYGIALGTLFPALVIEGIVFPLLICRLYSIGFREYLFRVYGSPVLIALVFYPTLYSTKFLLKPDTWMGLLLDGIMAASILLVLIVWIGMTAQERVRFLWAPIGRFWHRSRREAS